VTDQKFRGIDATGASEFVVSRSVSDANPAPPLRQTNLLLPAFLTVAATLPNER